MKILPPKLGKPKLSLASCTGYCIGFILLEAITVFGLLHHAQEKEALFLSRYILKLEDAYLVTVDTYGLVSQTIYDEVINQPEVIDIFKQAESATQAQRDNLRRQLFDRLNPTYQNLKQNNLKQLHFHLPDGTSFLRFHRPPKYGDPLFDVRYSVKIANTEKTFITGFEEGRIYNGFRYVFPLFASPENSSTEETRHIGSVETSISFQAIRQQMSQLFPAKYAFMLKKDVVRRKVFDSELDNYVPSDISDDFFYEKAMLNSPENAEESPLSWEEIKSINRRLKPLVQKKLNQNLAFAVPLQDEGKGYVVTFVPIKNVQGEFVAYLMAYECDTTIRSYRQDFALQLLGITFSAFLLVAFIFYVNQSKQVLEKRKNELSASNQQLEREIIRRNQTEEELVQSNQKLQGEIQGRIEAEALEREKSHQLEQALKQLQRTQAQLVQTEKMSSLGQLVAGIAHEINNPTSFIYGNITPAKEYAESLLETIALYQEYYPTPEAELQAQLEDLDLEFVREDFLNLLDSIQMGADRIKKIVQSLRIFSRFDEAELKAADIHQGIESTLMLLQNRLQKISDINAIEVVKEYGKLPLVECYPGLLNQVFMNVLVNAIDAIEECNQKRSASKMAANPGQIRIQTQLNESDRQVRIVIADNGCGIPEEVRDRIFDPFFTTKSIGKGTGLGLSMSYSIIVNRHEGSMNCRSILGQGTTFEISIPLKQNSAAKS